MPIAAADLFGAIGLTITGQTLWGTSAPCVDPCVYVVCLSTNPKRNDGLLASAPIELALVRAWMARVPTFSLDGHVQPKATDVAACLQEFWLPDENVLYIGQAKCLKKRIGAYFRHILGNPSPHKGGHWLKTLSNLNRLNLFFSNCASPKVKEAEALDAFQRQVSSASKALLHNPNMPIPFANRKDGRGAFKQRRIRRDVL